MKPASATRLAPVMRLAAGLARKVTARATSRIRDGDYTIILVNRGSSHGIRVGSRGKMCGKSLKVLRVYPSGTRAKARVKATKEQLGNCSSASISRRCE